MHLDFENLTTASSNVSAVHHHFLPQVYLRRFVSRQQKRLLWEFDKSDQVFRESTPKRSGYYDHLYTIKDAAGWHDARTLEEKFHDIENRIPALYEALRLEENPPSDETAIAFVLFAASMFIRVPGYIEMVGATETRKLRLEFERLRDDPAFVGQLESAGLNRRILERAVVQAERDYVLLKAIQGLKDPAVPFAQMAWQFFKSPPGIYFITGDHPVVHCNPGVPHALFELPLQDPEIEVTFPLSRTICAFGNWKGHQAWYRVVDEETVRIVNRRHWQAAVRFVYSPLNDHRLWT